MKSDISTQENIGNEFQFPVPQKKLGGTRFNVRKLLLRLAIGYLAIVIVVMGIRLIFFINSDFADGIVTDIKKSPRGYSFDPHIAFTSPEGRTITFIAAQNLRLDIGERVKVIYKKTNPQNAEVYSFFGFWFSYILTCQVLALFWVGLLVVYYGDYP